MSGFEFTKPDTRNPAPFVLLGFAMTGVFPAARAILLKFHATRIVTTILFGGVVSFFALAALQRDHWADIFFLGSHLLTLLSILFDDFGDNTRANGQTAFTDSKLRTLLQRHRHNQPTVTPTLTITPILSTSTGFMAPKAHKAVTTRAGDKNGYEKKAANAYKPDNKFASDLNSGINLSTKPGNTGKDRHVFYNYNLNIPTGALIQGIQVRLDARADNKTGSPKIYVQFSWNGGKNWTTAKATATLGTKKLTYLLGGTANTWGRAWSAADFSNANFRVRVIDVASNASRDFYLDYIAINVTYQP